MKQIIMNQGWVGLFYCILFLFYYLACYHSGSRPTKNLWPGELGFWIARIHYQIHLGVKHPIHWNGPIRLNKTQSPNHSELIRLLDQKTKDLFPHLSGKPRCDQETHFLLNFKEFSLFSPVIAPIGKRVFFPLFSW